MLDFMKWYHAVLFVMFILMVFSPVWFFSKVESLLTEDESVDKPWQYVTFVNTTNQLYPDLSDDDMEKELRIISNINKMIDKAKDKYSKNMWEVKKAEYLREIRWRRLTPYRG